MNKKTIYCIILWIISIIILLGVAYFLSNLVTHYKLTYILFIITTAIVILIINLIIYNSNENNLIPNFKIIIGFIAIIICLVFFIMSLNRVSRNNYYSHLTVAPVKQLLSNQIHNPGTLAYTDSIKFTSKTNSLYSERMSENTSIVPNQVKFVTNLENDFETNSSNNVLRYIKPTKGTYKIGIYCDYLEDNTIRGISAYRSEIPSVSNISWGDLDTQKVCVIFPKKIENTYILNLNKGDVFCWILGIILFGLFIFVGSAYYSKTKKIGATIGFVILSLIILFLIAGILFTFIWMV